MHRAISWFNVDMCPCTPSHLWCFLRRRSKTPKSKVRGEVSAGAMMTGDLADDGRKAGIPTQVLINLTKLFFVGCWIGEIVGDWWNRKIGDKLVYQILWDAFCCLWRVIELKVLALRFNLFGLLRLVLLDCSHPRHQSKFQQVNNFCPIGSYRNPNILMIVIFGWEFGGGQLPCISKKNPQVMKVYQVQHGPSWWDDVPGVTPSQARSPPPQRSLTGNTER